MKLLSESNNCSLDWFAECDHDGLCDLNRPQQMTGLFLTMSDNYTHCLNPANKQVSASADSHTHTHTGSHPLEVAPVHSWLHRLLPVSEAVLCSRAGKCQQLMKPQGNGSEDSQRALTHRMSVHTSLQVCRGVKMTEYCQFLPLLVWFSVETIQLLQTVVAMSC